MTCPCRLFVIPISHYCERARWALDHAGVAYKEVRWAVGLHVPLARRIAAGTGLPILDTGERIIQGSDRILDWTGMPGADPALERRFEDTVAPLIRQYVYSATLHDPNSNIRDVLFDGVSAMHDHVGRFMWPVTRRLMIRKMDTRPILVPDLERRLEAELDWFDGRVEGRRFLVGDRFGRADLTAASLLAPLARPAACPLYQELALPPRLQETFERWSVRPGLHWVGRLYDDHRRSEKDNQHDGPYPKHAASTSR